MIIVHPPPKEYAPGAWIAGDRHRPPAQVSSASSKAQRNAPYSTSSTKRNRKSRSKSKSRMKKREAKKKESYVNPVLESAEFAYRATNLVQINEEGVKTAALYIKNRLSNDSYTPRTWRTHPLHICPDDSADLTHPKNKLVLDWIFLISALNFSFWSEKDKKEEMFGVEWRSAWEDKGEKGRQVWTGYWSLVASLDRAISDDNIPITDPAFYSSPTLCSDAVIEHVFRRAEPTDRRETLPLLKERIAVMRNVGKKLCDDFGGSFLNFVQSFQQRYDGKGTALDLVKMVAETFPEFRDETIVEGRKVYVWKRAQILVAEIWAAFYPPTPPSPLPHGIRHPIFPHSSDIHLLTMFADYRVPQILHHLRILSYPPSLLDILHRGELLPSGCREEVSLRTASIVAVERVRREMVKMETSRGEEISSVLIDFYLWDLAKRIEDGEDKVRGIETAEMAPIHRTRSIWY